MRSTLRRALFLLTMLFCLPMPAQARELWRLEAPQSVRPLLERFLPPQQGDDESATGRRAAQLSLARRLRADINELLSTEGYFSPEVEIDTSDWPLDVRVNPGERTHIASVDIEFSGGITSQEYAERVKSLREGWLLPVDQAFRQADWTQAKDRLLQALSARDFAAARIADSVADIDPVTAAAHLRLSVDSGPAYVLGQVRFEGLEEYEDGLMQRYLILRDGEPYSRDRLLAQQAQFQSTPYFSAVEIDVQPEAAQGDRLPVRVRVAESKPKRVSVGLGYSTNTGFRSELGFRHNNFLDRAWQLASGVRLEQKRQAAFADVYLPRTEDDHRYSFGGLLDRSDIEGLRLFKQALGVVRADTRGDIEQSIGLSLQREDREVEGGSDLIKSALALNWSWTRRKVDSILDPRSGHVLQVQLGGGTQLLLSDANFMRSYGRVQFYLPVAPRDVLSFRVEAGYTAAKSRQYVPEDFLFRTGGAQTVRGYGYLNLGVKEGSATVGGRYMAAGSAEYVHWYGGNWGAAVFVDAGNAADELQGFEFKVGYGVGARWKSPAGNLAFDLAYGQSARRLRPHLAIAIAF